jgi:hypothetical protein
MMAFIEESRSGLLLLSCGGGHLAALSRITAQRLGGGSVDDLEVGLARRGADRAATS